MSVNRSSRQTHSQSVSSQALQFLEKVMTGFDQAAGGDSLEKAQARYEKLEARYEKLEERKEKLEDHNEKLRVENHEFRDEIRQLRVKVALLEAQVGSPMKLFL
jgi:chromosome segregation ATPase